MTLQTVLDDIRKRPGAGEVIPVIDLRVKLGLPRVEPTARTTAENAARTLPLLVELGVRRAVVVCAPLHFVRRKRGMQYDVRD